MRSNRSGLFTKLPMLVFGLLMLLPATASAQIWSQDDYRRERERQRREEIRERRRERRQERRQERRADRRNDGYYNNGVYNDGYYRNNGGYNNGYGNRTYGTRDNYPNYGGSYDARQTALNAGYNNGIEEGRRDRQRGESYNFQDEGEFQSATKDYNSRYGDREIYRRYFREAYARGYRDGYNGY